MVETPYPTATLGDPLIGLFDSDHIDLPTFGSVWTHRQRRFSHSQVRGCYPALSEQFDVLLVSSVMWEPYNNEAVAARFQRDGDNIHMSILCAKDEPYWLTKLKIVYSMLSFVRTPTYSPAGPEDLAESPRGEDTAYLRGYHVHPLFGHCSPPGTTASSAALDAPPPPAATLAPTTVSPSTAYTTDDSETSSPRPGWRFDVASSVFFRLLAATASTFARWRFVVAAPAAGALGSPSHAKLRVSPTATTTGSIRNAGVYTWLSVVYVWIRLD
jgi:hypothetical protein